MQRVIEVARDFSRSPAGRFRDDGPYSGQTFRDKFLLPALRRGETVVLEMDGTRGYGSSFLDEAFGGLRRLGEFTVEDLLRRVVVHSRDPSLAMEVNSYLAGG